MKVQAFKVDVADAAGYTVVVTLSPEDAGHQKEVLDEMFYLGAELKKNSPNQGEDGRYEFYVASSDISSFVAHVKSVLSTVMSRKIEQPIEEKTASISGGFNMELIWNKQAFMAVKERMSGDKYITEGPKESLNFKPKAPAVPTSQKTDTKIGGEFVESGEVSKLQYPKVTKKESTMEIKAAQQLPGSDSIDAGSVIEKGEKEKLTYPSKAGPSPAIKMQGLDVSNDAKKQIDGGEKGKISHGNPGKGKDIKIEWQVNSDTSIGGKFMEKGDKGDIKKAPAHAPEPSVSMKTEPGADANIERGEASKPIQKQFSLNFKRASAEEREVAVSEAVDNAILELEVAAAKCGVNLTTTRLAPIYTGLLAVREGIARNGSLFALTLPAPTPAPLKVQASLKPTVDLDKAAIDVGARIF